MPQFGGKDSNRHFTVVMGGKEHGLYVSSTPSSAAKKAVTKLCASNKSKKVEFHIREITQGSKKKTYGPYLGYIEKKLTESKYKPKIFTKKSSMKGGLIIGPSPTSTCDQDDYYWRDFLKNYNINNSTINKIINEQSYDPSLDHDLKDIQKNVVSIVQKNKNNYKSKLQKECKEYRKNQEERVTELKDEEKKTYGFKINKNNYNNLKNNILLLKKQKENINDDIIHIQHTFLRNSIKPKK